jgi:hypothetical protein
MFKVGTARATIRAIRGAGVALAGFDQLRGRA